MALDMFELVPESSIDRSQHQIMRSRFVDRIKWEADGKFNKLNPRWCLIGTDMDPETFKSFAEQMRMSSFKMFPAIEAAYMPWLIPFEWDLKDAFQSTRRDDYPEGEIPDQYGFCLLYTSPSPRD